MKNKNTLMIKFNCYKFSALSLEQLYAVLALRADVFVVGQKCLYLDPDGKDKFALHFLGMENNELAAYTRLFPPNSINNNEIIFGRVAVATSARGKVYGKLLMQQVLDYCSTHFSNVPIKCSAQHYLQKFYEEFGFVAQGNIYHEDHIPHIEMVRS